MLRLQCGVSKRRWHFPTLPRLAIIDDDDELAEPQWLEQLCATAERFGADCRWPATADIPESSGRGSSAIRSLHRNYRESGPFHPVFVGNLLIGRMCWKRWGRRSSTSLHFMGVGDADFLIRRPQRLQAGVVRRGGDRETVPHAGSSPTGFRSRACASGVISTLVENKKRAASPVGNLRVFAKSLALLARLAVPRPAEVRQDRSAVDCSLSRLIAIVRASSRNSAISNEQYRQPAEKLTAARSRGHFIPQRVATIMAAILLTTVIVSFRPFQPGGAELTPKAAATSSISSLQHARRGGAVRHSDFRQAACDLVFFSPCWLLLMASSCCRCSMPRPPSAAARAAFFTVIGIVTIVAVLALPRDADSFSATLAFAWNCRRRGSYVGVVLLPYGRSTRRIRRNRNMRPVARAVRAQEPGRAVMACFSFAGLYLMRRGWKYRGLFFWPRPDLHGQYRLKNHRRRCRLPHDRRAARPGRHALLTVALFALAVVALVSRRSASSSFDPLKHSQHTISLISTYTGRVTLWEFAGGCSPSSHVRLRLRHFGLEDAAQHRPAVRPPMGYPHHRAPAMTAISTSRW